MTRMTRELTTVLLGTGLLTAGYFVMPEQDYEKRADEQALKRVGGNGNGNGNGGTRRSGGMLVFIHSSGGGYSSSGGARPAGMSSVSKGGFGSVGGRVSGGG